MRKSIIFLFTLLCLALAIPSMSSELVKVDASVSLVQDANFEVTLEKRGKKRFALSCL